MSPIPTYEEFIKKFEDIRVIRILKIRKIWEKYDQKS